MNTQRAWSRSVRISPAAALAWACAALVPPIAAQQSEGALVGTPAVMLVGSGTASSGGALPTDSFVRKTAGFLPVGPEIPPVNPLEPVFTTTALFGGGVGPPDFEVNAMSLGIDEVLSEMPSGGLAILTIPSGAWGTLLFSVTRGTVGDAGSVIEQERASGDGAGADLFTLMLPESVLPGGVASCYPTDAPQRALDATEMDLYDGLSPGEISAVDIFMPLYQAGPPLRPELSNTPTVFFSVSSESIFPAGGGGSAVPPGWFGASAPSPATILRTTWSPGQMKWSTPVPHLTFAQLGLDITDDIDALAVDVDDCLALFSIVRTTTSTLDEQLQVATWCSPFLGSVETGIWVTDEGEGRTEPVAGRLRVDCDGDVDGTCVVDPGGKVNALSLAFGTPIAKATFFKLLGSAVFRDAATLGPTVTPTVTGVPTTAAIPAQQIELWLGIPHPVTGSYLFLSPIWGEVITGANPRSTREVPITIPALGSLLGANLDLFWVVRPGAPKVSSVITRIDV